MKEKLIEEVIQEKVSNALKNFNKLISLNENIQIQYSYGDMSYGKPETMKELQPRDTAKLDNTMSREYANVAGDARGVARYLESQSKSGGAVSPPMALWMWEMVQSLNGEEKVAVENYYRKIFGSQWNTTTFLTHFPREIMENLFPKLSALVYNN